LVERRKELQRIASECREELKKIESALFLFSGRPEKRISWTNEILRFFNENEGKSKTTEILQWIFAGSEPELGDAARRRTYITGLSVALMNLVKKGVIQSISLPGEKGRIYFMTDSTQQMGEDKKSTYSQLHAI
jgi:hypothetical protein